MVVLTEISGCREEDDEDEEEEEEEVEEDSESEHIEGKDRDQDSGAGQDDQHPNAVRWKNVGFDGSPGSISTQTLMSQTFCFFVPATRDGRSR